MLDQNIILFSIFILAGFLIIIFGFKFSNTTRKVIETIGAMTFHLGVFGILYNKVSLNLFISLFTLVISLFILLDPLKISMHMNDKIYKLFGHLLLCTALAFGIQFLTGFPVWPWIIPVVLYLAPYLLSPLKRFHGLINLASWLLVFAYTLTIGLVLYGHFMPGFDSSFITKRFAQQGYLSQHDQDRHKTRPKKSLPKEEPAVDPVAEPHQIRETETPNSANEIPAETAPENNQPVSPSALPALETVVPPNTAVEIQSVPVSEPQPVAGTLPDSGAAYFEPSPAVGNDVSRLAEEKAQLQNKYNDLLRKNIELEKEIEDLKNLIHSQENH
ncbi:MAG: hypothetical protein ACD_62C00510G0007 [uncultured bacterium]|nr:MAG: hypothetical protein ACD_62C00510G0007 [uncultured bacterium]